MPRLINADKLRNDVLDLPNCYNGFSDTYDKAMILDLVDEQPTVDAEPVVRCKDCSLWCICHHSDNWFCANGTPISTASDSYDDKGHLINNPPTYKTLLVRHGHLAIDSDPYKSFEQYAEKREFIEVVRCKDCKYCSVDRCADGNVPDYVCIEMDCGVEADDFCSRGERK